MWDVRRWIKYKLDLFSYVFGGNIFFGGLLFFGWVLWLRFLFKSGGGVVGDRNV